MLPGGVWQQGELRHDFVFHAVNGHLELALAEAASVAQDVPGQVSHVLHAALAQLAGQEPDLDQVDGLSVGDRQFLMTRLAGHLGLGRVWLSALCGACHSHFDFSLDYADIPVKPAGEGYPCTEIELSLGSRRIRVPTGADQRAVLGHEDEADARRVLVACCLEGSANGLGDQDLARIERVLEAMAPELATQATGICPECTAENAVEIDPYICLGRVGNELFVEIHQLAVHYHWSEAEILSLPRWRRRKYLDLIDRTRGITN